MLISPKIVETAPQEWPRHLFGLPLDRWRALSGRTFLVTGAGTGFGRSAAAALAAAGGRVFLMGRRLEKLNESLKEMEALGIPGGGCSILRTDLTDRTQIMSACEWIERTSPSLDGLIHSAALPSTPGNPAPLLGDPVQAWDLAMATNVTAAWLLGRRLFPHMLKSGRIRMVFYGSGAGWAATPGKGIYNISKAALNALTHSLAAEAAQVFPDADVQINLLVPTEARTEMNRAATRSPYAIAPMTLALLSHPAGGPNGRFFGMDGDHRGFGSTPPYERPLLPPGTQAHTPQNGPPPFNRLILDRCLRYDGGVQDRHVLTLFAQSLRTVDSGLALYGAGRLARYLLEQFPDLRTRLVCLLDDDPKVQAQPFMDLPVVPPADLPDEVQSLFLCSTRFVSLGKMVNNVRKLKRQVRYISTVSVIQQQPQAGPPYAMESQPPNIYPVDIPGIDIASGLDLALLELPPRYIPMLPNGLAQVHNIVKTTSLRHQTLDLNLIFYHRHWTRRFCDGRPLEPWFANAENRMDPWENFNTDEWDKPGVVDYFREDLDELAGRLIEASPRILGFSLNGNNRLLILELIRLVKAQRPDTLILVGGYDCVNPVMALKKFTEFDYMVIGEAELTLPGLLEALKRGERPGDLPGIFSKFDTPGRLFEPGPKPQDLDALGFPTYDFIDIRLYRSWSGHILNPICSSRGCAWSRCNFCAEHNQYRKRNPVLIVDEIEWHMKHGFDNFCSNESDVNGDPENLLAICHEIIRRKLKLRFSGQLRIDRRSDLDFFKTLKAAGFTQLTFGVDGWTDNILYRQRKGYRIATVDQNLADARKAGLVVCVNMVVGAPGETDEDVEEAIRNVIRNKAYIWQFSTINMMRLVTNSRFYNDPDKYHIRFRGDKDQIYAVNHFRIPEELWYSENPYIDHHIRAQRYEYIRSELAKNGIRVGDYARFANTREVRRIRDAEPPAAEAPQSEPSRSVLAV